MSSRHEEDVVRDDTYLGCIEVLEGDEEGIRCDRCHRQRFRTEVLLSFDGSGVPGEFDCITVCEQCLLDLAAQAQPRATAAIAEDAKLPLEESYPFSSIEWTETLSPKPVRNPELTISVRFDWDDGTPCDRCQRRIVNVPTFAFDGTGGKYDPLVVCKLCTNELISKARSDVMSECLSGLKVTRTSGALPKRNKVS